MRVAIGTFLAGLIGALVAVFVSIFQEWTGGFTSQLISGLIVGGIPGLLLGWFMAIHGGGLAGSEQRAASAPAWGVVTGLVYGASLGPVFCGVCGLTIGLLFDFWGWNALGQSLGADLLVHGLKLGLYTGPIVALLGWESAFFIGSSEALAGSSAD